MGMTNSKRISSKSSSKTQDSAGDAASQSKAEALSNLSAQRAQALANNDTKTAFLIERIIRLLEKKK